jgi:hypothetical protein
MTDPEIAATFRRDADGFTSRCDRDVSCPPWVIVMVASDRVHPAALTLPAGYDIGVLGNIRLITGAYDQEVFISRHQAAGLAEIGRQLLTLDDLGDIEIPLNPRERESVEYLVSLCGESK